MCTCTYVHTYIPLNRLPFLLWSGHTGHSAPLLYLCTCVSVCFCVFLCVFVSVHTHNYTSTHYAVSDVRCVCVRQCVVLTCWMVGEGDYHIRPHHGCPQLTSASLLHLSPLFEVLVGKSSQAFLVPIRVRVHRLDCTSNHAPCNPWTSPHM